MGQRDGDGLALHDGLKDVGTIKRNNQCRCLTHDWLSPSFSQEKHPEGCAHIILRTDLKAIQPEPINARRARTLNNSDTHKGCAAKRQHVPCHNVLKVPSEPQHARRTLQRLSFDHPAVHAHVIGRKLGLRRGASTDTIPASTNVELCKTGGGVSCFASTRRDACRRSRHSSST